MILRLSSSLSLENDTGLNKEIIHYVSFDMYEKEDVNVENPDNNQTIAQTNSENDSSSEFQECLDRAEDLSRRIRALSPKSETNENTNETSRVDSNQRLSRRQSVMIRRIFEKYSDIIGRLALTMAVFYLPNINRLKSFVSIDYIIELLH